MSASRVVGLLTVLSFLSTVVGSALGDSNDVHVTVESVSDSRSTATMMPRCQVQLRVSGDEVADAFDISSIRITTAVDDTGRDLKLDPEHDRMRPPFSSGRFYAVQFSHTVELSSPARSARFIKTLEGELDLLFPTPENGGMVIVRDFLKHPGELLSNPSLKSSNISITFLDKDSAENNWNGGVPVSPRMPHNAFRSGSAHQLRFSVDDPDHRLADMAFIDAYGRQLPTGGSTYGSTIRTYTLQENVPSNLQLYIYLTVPAAIKTIPFKIENIELP